MRGVTTNPTIFDKAISTGADAYAEQLAALAATGADVDAIIRALTTDDVRAACDVFAELWQESGGVDGRVSIEVDPRLADETDATIAQARSSGRPSVGRTPSSRSPPPGPGSRPSRRRSAQGSA